MSQDATLGTSTSRPPASRASSKPPSRAAVPKKKPVPEIEEISSDDDDEPVTTTRSKVSQAKPGTLGRASSVPTKTPGSRKSARSTATTTRSRTTAGSEDDAEASGSDAGKRVSKTKRKAAVKGKERIEAIEEEEEDINIEEHNVPEEPVVVKPKRGRPPKAKTAAARAKKAAAEQETVPVDTEPEAVAPPSKPTHSRTRTKANVDTESAPSASKPKSLVKDGVKLVPTVEVPLRQPSMNRARHETTAPSDSEGDESYAAALVKPKPNGVSRAKSRAKNTPPDTVEGDDERMARSSARDEPARNLMPPPPVPSEPAKPKNRKSSSTSDDAGYATAEYAMDIDPIPATQPPQSRHQRNSSQPSSTKAVSPPPATTRQSRAASIEPSRGTSQPPSRSSSKPAGRPSARPGSVRPPSRLNSEAVPISSDEEDALVKPAPKAIKRIVSKQKLADERARSRTPVVNGTHDVEMDAQPENAQPGPRQPKPKAAPARTPEMLEIAIVKPLPPPVPVEEDVEMVEETPPPPPEVSPKLDATIPPPLVNGTVSRKTSSATPPPRTPSLPLAEPEPADKPARILPSFDDEMESGVPEDIVEIPFLSDLPLQKLTSLTEDECNLTIEQYIKREIEREYSKIKEDGERQIALFLERAAERRRQLEAV